MVNDSLRAAEMEMQLALSYAPGGRRSALRALWTLDERLADILRTTREPLVGQMRLTWWHGALAALDEAPAAAEPVLQTLAADVMPLGVAGGELAALVEGWEALLDARVPDDRAIAWHGKERGGRLFSLAARILGEAEDRVVPLGEGWALADLAAHLSDPRAAERAAGMARERLACVGGWWPRPLRPLAALAWLARDDLRGGVAGSPRRVGRLLALRLTGR